MRKLEAAGLVALLAAAGLGPYSARADGALALAVPANIAKDGFAYGWAFNHPTTGVAKDAALKECQTTTEGSVQANKICRIYDACVDQCVSISMDPKAGTSGVGWAIADDLAAAGKSAPANSRASAGEGREKFCVISTSKCDGTAE